MSIKNINWGRVFFGEKEERKGKFKKAVKSNLIEILIALVLFGLLMGYRWSQQNGSLDEETFESQLGSLLASSETTAAPSVSVTSAAPTSEAFDFAAVPDNVYYVEVNGNTPYFVSKKGDVLKISDEPYEEYSELDNLGRCGVANACVCVAVMPAQDEERADDLSSVKPTGYHVIQDDEIENGFLYNRCHLIGYQLAGENANELNLITGTRQFNVEGMQPFENEIAFYIYDHPDNHVIYRVTPMFQGNELVARGVLMEAYSVEDNGEGICFCVFVPNVQQGYVIDYATGNAEKKEN